MESGKMVLMNLQSSNGDAGIENELTDTGEGGRQEG